MTLAEKTARIRPQTTTEELVGLVGRMRIEVNGDKTATITPGREITGNKARILADVERHGPNADLTIRLKTPKDSQPICLGDHELLLRSQKNIAGRDSLNDGSARFDNIPPGAYTIELVKKTAGMPGPKLDVGLM
ncbi:MAG: hypothetical protein PHG85_00380 [Candidatus Altiarchaeota archaeon]|nr:hypothetical protein [Candidatus Altiarchaeota archaeon]